MHECRLAPRFAWRDFLPVKNWEEWEDKMKKFGYQPGTDFFAWYNAQDGTTKFKIQADGQDSFYIKDVKGPSKWGLEKFADAEGIKDGKITLKEYLRYDEQRQA